MYQDKKRGNFGSILNHLGIPKCVKEAMLRFFVLQIAVNRFDFVFNSQKGPKCLIIIFLLNPFSSYNFQAKSFSLFGKKYSLTLLVLGEGGLLWPWIFVLPHIIQLPQPNQQPKTTENNFCWGGLLSVRKPHHTTTPHRGLLHLGRF